MAFSKAAFVFWIVAIVSLGVAAWFVLFHSQPAHDRARGTDFVESATQAGLTWRMKFLNNEQGEHFKINLYDHGCGVAVADFDGDGHDDIYLVNQLGRNALYRNRGDGTFADVTEKAGVGLGDRICTMATFADYDNSGRQSLFVTSTRGGNVLLKNLGDGKFEDVTKKAGLAHVGHSQACVFFDYDNDGFLDLLVTNTAQWTTDRFDSASRYYVGKPNLLGAAVNPIEYNILYHNNRDGTFTDVTEKAGVKGNGWGSDVLVFDLDDDGYLDFMVIGMFGGTTLYRNNGDGTFTDVTMKYFPLTSWGGMGGQVFDFNNDGKLDLFVVDMHSDMWMGLRFDWPEETMNLIREAEKKKFKSPAGPQLNVDWDLALKERQKDSIFGNSLFKNLGRGTFEEKSDRANLETLWPWGAAVGDFDNDGYEDIFIPTGMGYPFFYWPNYLMMNNHDETFTDRAEATGMEPPARGIYAEEKISGRPATRSSRSAAVADFDGDGRLDLIVNNFNDQPYYFRNHFPKKNYLALRLQGTKSNRDAIGALVTLYVGNEIMTRLVKPASGYLSQSSKTVHFGLGDRAKIDRVEIRWPSGIRQTIENPTLNQLHRISEPKE
jgi:hypothetical protein